ncbi:hypothetical protein P7K49_030317 [Saguinus oedipus]|uniref:Uncharacterized protein n=1 Tax=Saguinus oedipus TaxID=9490 RepID=A0ABQ9U1U9_SAGOE|nr:hypothetical protein P7K49_030317 [Saguinus oedipus]
MAVSWSNLGEGPGAFGPSVLSRRVLLLLLLLPLSSALPSLSPPPAGDWPGGVAAYSSVAANPLLGRFQDLKLLPALASCVRPHLSCNPLDQRCGEPPA